MQRLYERTALVMGGTSGIGEAIATPLVHEGVNVAIDAVGPRATKSAIEEGIAAGLREVNECSQPSRAVVVEAAVSDEALAADLLLRRV